ncbi:hypothetical protein QYE76_019194 [Lolium multiflorum]|uniref:Uncharacterized protein n=1 Tax=Lolium multiflorum TaxID=4521 RepID=A0AAD8R4J6_LOLMU|nr:hypothetical protein QYE76_019194 [Lolium multiflorum]
MAAEDLEWERSKISAQDINLLKKLGISKKKDSLRFPSEESYPSPPIEYRNHKTTSPLPPLPEGGEVEEWTVVTDDNQGTSRPESEVAGSQKSAASSEKEVESEATASTHSLPSAVSPRKREKGTKLSILAPPEPAHLLKLFLLRKGQLSTLTRMPLSALVSEAQPDGDETSPPQQDIEHPTPIASPRAPSPKRARVEPAKEPTLPIGSSTTPSMDDPLMKEFIRLGTQFIGYRDHAKKLEVNLAEANKRADALALELEQSEKARKKAETDVAAVEDLRKKLQDAEASLSKNIAQQSAREEDIITRLESQSRCFVRRTQQDYDLENPEGDRLLDALSLLEIHGDEARQGLTDARIVLSRPFPFYFMKKEEPETFTALAKCFKSKEDLGPAFDRKA